MKKSFFLKKALTDGLNRGWTLLVSVKKTVHSVEAH